MDFWSSQGPPASIEVKPIFCTSGQFYVQETLPTTHNMINVRFLLSTLTSELEAKKLEKLEALEATQILNNY